MQRDHPPVSRRIARLQWVLPPAIGGLVLFYQFVIVRLLDVGGYDRFHYLIEILLYGLVGPLVTYLVLGWIRRWQLERERLELKAREQERRLTTLKLEENRRVAQHLHREVLPNLAYLANKLDLIQGKLGGQAARAGELQEWATVLRETVADLREKIRALRRGTTPHALTESADFLAEVRRRARQFERLFKIPARVVVRGPQRAIPRTLENNLWRILGEALNNVALHARAGHVGIELDFHAPNALTLRVRDDGVGFEVGKALRRRSGLGLLHIQEEAQVGEGELRFLSSPGRGTCVEVRFPLGEEDG